LKAQAKATDFFQPVNEPIHELIVEGRHVLRFGSKRRAMQTICADLLDVQLPTYEFDYLVRGRGADSATLRLKEIIETGGYDYVVTADILNAYGSINKTKLAALIPLPAPVVNSVLLVQDDVEVWPAKQEVTGEPDNLFPSKLNSSQPTPADTGARKGLPTGSKTSTMILSRSILCPLIDASPYRDRAVLHGDDVAIAAKGEEEAKDTLHNLRSIFENSPVGPLTVGRHAIRHITERINFAKYGLRQDSYRPGSALEACPSARSYDRFLARAEEKYLDKRASTPTRNAGTVNAGAKMHRLAGVKVRHG
jgi:hypothetical protein